MAAAVIVAHEGAVAVIVAHLVVAAAVIGLALAVAQLVAHEGARAGGAETCGDLRRLAETEHESSLRF